MARQNVLNNAADHINAGFGTFIIAGSNTIPLQAAATNSGNNVSIAVTNNSNTAGSNAQLLVSVAGTSAGDPFTFYQGSATSWGIGVDTSDSSKFKINTGDGPSGGTNILTFLTTGKVAFNSPTAAPGTNESFSFYDSVNGGLGLIVSFNNRDADSGIALNLVTSATATGDLQLMFSTKGTPTWSIGCDVSATGAFSISNGNALGTTEALSIAFDRSSAVFKTGELLNQFSVDSSYCQLAVQNTHGGATSSTRIVISNIDAAGDCYMLFDPHFGVGGDRRFQIGQTQADVFQITSTTDTSTSNMNGTTVLQASTIGLISVPNANGAAGLVVGGTTIGTNDAFTLTGEGTGVGGLLQFSMRASGTSIPILTITSGNAAVSPSLDFGVAGVTGWGIGENAGSSNSLQIWSGTGFGVGSRVLEINTSGSVTKPLQPSFYARAAAQTDVTGDGTTYTLTFTTVDRNIQSCFDGTSTFTAPVAGVYLFTVGMDIVNGLSSGSTDFFATIAGAAFTSRLIQFEPGNMTPSGNELIFCVSQQVYMTAAQTAVVQVKATGGSKTIGVTGGSSATFFSATLLG